MSARGRSGAQREGKAKPSPYFQRPKNVPTRSRSANRRSTGPAVPKQKPPSTPQNPPRPVQADSGNTVTIGNKTFSENDPQLAILLEQERNKYGPHKDLRGGGGIKLTADPLAKDPERFAKPSGGGTGRSDKRVSPTGLEQTGTNTGMKPMTLADIEGEGGLFSRIGLAGTKVMDPFSSNQLPSTKANPNTPDIEGMGPLSNAEEYGQFLNPGAKDGVSGIGPVVDGDVYAKNVNNAVYPTDTAEDPKNSGINWGARSAADNSDPNIARRRAFLDAEDSLAGLRGAEATQGIVYAGGQHHIINPNRGQEGQNDFFTVDNKDDIRGYKSGRLSAQDMLSKHVGAIKEAQGSGESAKEVPNEPMDTPMEIKRGSLFDDQMVY